MPEEPQEVEDGSFGIDQVKSWRRSSTFDVGHDQSPGGAWPLQRSWTFEVVEDGPSSVQTQAEDAYCHHALSPGASPNWEGLVPLPATGKGLLDAAFSQSTVPPGCHSARALCHMPTGQWSLYPCPAPPAGCSRPSPVPGTGVDQPLHADFDSRSCVESSAGSYAGGDSNGGSKGPAGVWTDSGDSAPMNLGSPEWPTLGSMAHYYGTCKPCAFMTKGCLHGVRCPFCHICDSREKDRRKKTKTALFHHLHRQKKWKG